ncbi:MAG TPA: glycosyltransferase 87 family protein [Thermoleophilaceae bacterium]
MRLSLRVTLPLVLFALLLVAAPARADSVAPVQSVWPAPTVVPPGYKLTSIAAHRIALNSPVGRKLRAKYPGIPSQVYIAGIHDGIGYWQIDFLGKKIPLGEVEVNGENGRIVKSFMGWQAANPQSRGHLARMADSWWVWLPLCLLFVAPFIDPRRPFRLLHLDLAMLLAFGISHLVFNQGHVLASVPLVYPVLAYLLARMLWAGLRARIRREALVPYARTSWLVAGIVVLLAFRIFVNVANDQVIDVGYAGVVGADRIEHKQPLYLANDAHGDTYGPVNYLAYVPFELVFPNHGAWDSLPAAHAATIFFDLMVLAGLFMAGVRLRAGPAGRRLGITLAYAWVAYPYTLYALATNTNDALVAGLLVLAFLSLRSPAARGGWLGLGAAAKFIPLALAPLFATGTGERRPRQLARFALALAAVVAISLGVYVPRSSFHDFWASTISYQLHRVSPFSIWTLYPSLHWLQLLVAAGAGALAVAVAFVPRRRDAVQVAALAAAVLIATQLPSGHWFYFYIVWFAPFVLIALFASHVEGDPGEEIALASAKPAADAAARAALVSSPPA